MSSKTWFRSAWKRRRRRKVRKMLSRTLFCKMMTATAKTCPVNETNL